MEYAMRFESPMTKFSNVREDEGPSGSRSGSISAASGVAGSEAPPTGSGTPGEGGKTSEGVVAGGAIGAEEEAAGTGVLVSEDPAVCG